MYLYWKLEKLLLYLNIWVRSVSKQKKELFRMVSWGNSNWWEEARSVGANWLNSVLESDNSKEVTEGTCC